jgi:D-arabinose 1-dehydrogenase-like Zn-dependent alcohol dehydrogenase
LSVRAAVIPAPGLPVEVRKFPEPVLEPGAALLRTTYSEVCGTDVHLQHGRLAGVHGH